MWLYHIFHHIINSDTTLTTLSNLHALALKVAENKGKLSVIHSANTGFRKKKITLIININGTVVVVIIVIIIPTTLIVITVLAVAFCWTHGRLFSPLNSKTAINNRKDTGKAMHKETGIIALPQIYRVIEKDGRDLKPL